MKLIWRIRLNKPSSPLLYGVQLTFAEAGAEQNDCLELGEPPSAKPVSLSSIRPLLMTQIGIFKLRDKQLTLTY